MNVSTIAEEEVCVVSVAGDVDASNVGDLRAALDDLVVQGQRNFVVDLTSVGFMDSSGLATLVQLFKRVRIGEGDVRVCGLSPKVERVYKLIRLDRVFDTFASRDEAVHSFNAPD